MTNEVKLTAKQALSFKITQGSDISDFFTQKTGLDFINWFNANCANKDAWVGKHLGKAPETRQRFEQVWEQFPLMFGTKSINLAQFIALSSIFINEVGAEMLPLTEKVGRAGHPGLAYPFDTIPGIKISYNQPPNKTALELFNDPLFIKKKGRLALAASLKKTSDKRWGGDVFPQAEFTTSTDPELSGFIREADFFKFRGRGFIQTTWRSNYILLVKFIQTYTGKDATVLRFKKRWAGLEPDDVATISSNEDWDKLFQESNLEIACAGIRMHSQASGSYLDLSNDLLTITGTGKGSVFSMGLRISGSRAYATLFSERVLQIIVALSKTVVSPVL